MKKKKTESGNKESWQQEPLLITFNRRTVTITWVTITSNIAMLDS